MILSVIVSIRIHMLLLTGISLLAFALLVCGQGFEVRSQTQSIPAYTELLKRPIDIKQELKSVHPRLFFTASDILGLREKAKGVNAELWQATLKEIQTLHRKVP